jgi:flagellin-like protein
MKLNVFDTDDRGQVGIGTLIVFIAMVLVAAIAAGVLINTAGFLQTQSQATGEESTQQVANNLEILSTTGQVNNSTQINETRIVVQKTAGSDDIDLNETTVQWLGPDSSVTLTHGRVDDIHTGGFDYDENFNTSAITDSDEEVLGKRSHRIAINVTLEGVAKAEGSPSDDDEYLGGQLTNLEEGEEVQLTLTLQSGAQRTTVLQVPDSLSSESNGDDVRL